MSAVFITLGNAVEFGLVDNENENCPARLVLRKRCRQDEPFVEIDLGGATEENFDKLIENMNRIRIFCSP